MSHDNIPSRPDSCPKCHKELLYPISHMCPVPVQPPARPEPEDDKYTPAQLCANIRKWIREKPRKAFWMIEDEILNFLGETASAEHMKGPARPDVPHEVENLMEVYDAACAEYAIYVQSDKPSSARRIEAKLKRGEARAALSTYRPQVPTLAAQSNVGTPPMEILREFFHKGDVGSVSRRSWDIARDAFQKLATPKPQAEAHEADTREALARHLWKQHFEGTEMEGSWSVGKETQAHFYGEADKILEIISKSPQKEIP